MTACVIRLDDHRPAVLVPEIDLFTAVDVVLRDLRDIQDNWGSEDARLRLNECRDLLQRAFDEGAA